MRNHEWVNADDELPYEDGTYLVCTNTSNTFMTHFYSRTCSWARSTGHIAYWMPLPEPPIYRGADGQYVILNAPDPFGEEVEYMVKEAPFRWGGFMRTWKCDLLNSEKLFY